MRKVLFFVFLSLASAFVQAQNIDVLHYHFNLEVSDANDSLIGGVEIKFIHRDAGKFVRFDLKGLDKNGKGMVVRRVMTVGAERAFVRFQQLPEQIEIPTPYAKPGDTSGYLILYSGIPSDGLIISKNKYGDRTFFADNWPNRAHNWIPCIDKPDDKASFEFVVRAPAHYSVISNGIKVQEKVEPNNIRFTHWEEDSQQPTKVMVIGVAKFATKVFENSPKGIPISAWVYPQDSTKGFYDYALATDIVKFFSDYIAPFPYKKLANVQSKTIFGGMENASCIFYAESSVTGDRRSEDLLAHEIAHQWFGDMASEKSFAHLWLSEGFATYFTDLYFEHKYGREAMNKRLQKEREEAIEFSKQTTHAVVDSTPDLMSLLNANSYQKGAWVLHMLRNEVGDSVFHKIIQSYYNKYKGSNADTRDFEQVAEQVSKDHLDFFFRQWLYRPKVPNLTITWSTADRKLSVTIVQEKGEPYQFPLKLKFLKKDGSVVNWGAMVTRSAYTFTYPYEIGVTALEVDPNTEMLFNAKVIRQQ